MSIFLLGYIGVLTGAITVGVVLFGLYKYETAQRNKLSKKLSDELKSMLQDRLSVENHPRKNNIFN